MSTEALNYAEIHALMFADWLIETQATRKLPLTFLRGEDAPMYYQTQASAFIPTFAKGGEFLGRPAYGQGQLYDSGSRSQGRYDPVDETLAPPPLPSPITTLTFTAAAYRELAVLPTKRRGGGGGGGAQHQTVCGPAPPHSPPPYEAIIPQGALTMC